MVLRPVHLVVSVLRLRANQVPFCKHGTISYPLKDACRARNLPWSAAPSDGYVRSRDGRRVAVLRPADLLQFRRLVAPHQRWPQPQPGGQRLLVSVSSAALTAELPDRRVTAGDSQEEEEQQIMARRSNVRAVQEELLEKAVASAVKEGRERAGQESEEEEEEVERREEEQRAEGEQRTDAGDVEGSGTPAAETVRREARGSAPDQQRQLSTAEISAVAVGCVVAAAAFILGTALVVQRTGVLQRRSILSEPPLDDTRLSYINASTDFSVSELGDEMTNLENLDNDSFLNSLESMTDSMAGQTCWSREVRHLKL
ncbi:hypothetical protein FJT64_013617 [Amphibalanus amphitrite]|uniref:Uncharacterized protein n=1 Tax=Amphibalanus amphitrite TaxID=1232801 RepID=A0A6A4VEG2_AMPAM|nr:hypothetical protein FJT64_013617 [Amphibalanus amphitrite]